MYFSLHCFMFNKQNPYHTTRSLDDTKKIYNCSCSVQIITGISGISSGRGRGGEGGGERGGGGGEAEG